MAEPAGQREAAAGCGRAAGPRDCWCRIPRGNHPRAAACSLAGRLRCGRHRGSGRCRVAKHQACRPFAVPSSRDAPRRSRRQLARGSQPPARPRRRQSISFACCLLQIQWLQFLPARAETCAMNEARKGSQATRSREDGSNFHMLTGSASSPSKNASSKTPPALRRARGAGRRAASPDARLLRVASSL